MHNIEQVAGGFSGALVYRVIAGEDQFALKRLPPGTDCRRVKQIHQTVAQLRATAARQGLGGLRLPSYEGLIQCGGAVWEASRWQTGQPLAADASINQVRAGVRAILTLHRVAKDMSPPVRLVAPAVKERIVRLTSAGPVPKDPDQVAARYCHLYPAAGAGQRDQFQQTFCAAVMVVQQGWPVIADRLMKALRTWGSQPVVCHAVVRDIHRMHLLFDLHDEPGFIDFDGMRLDTPAIDLARWVGSFTAPRRPEASQQYWDQALAGSEDENAYPSNSDAGLRRWVRLMHESGVWGSLQNWCEWISQGRRFGPSDGLSPGGAGLVMVTQRLDHLVGAAAVTLHA